MVTWSCRNRYALGSWELDESGPLAKAMFARNVEERVGAAPVSFLLLVAYHLLFGAFIRYQAERYRVPVIPLLAIVCVVGLLQMNAMRRGISTFRLQDEALGGDRARGALS
jgi:hypothetical protein